MRIEDAIARYGEIKAGIWLEENNWCSFLDIPEAIGKSWYNRFGGQPIKHIYCNKDFQDPLIRALENVLSRGLIDELNTFDGCYHIRSVRGEPNRISAHSYGIAIDINASVNPLGGPSKFSQEFVRCFKDAGLWWGGDFHRMDPMHFSMGW